MMTPVIIFYCPNSPIIMTVNVLGFRVEISIEGTFLKCLLYNVTLLWVSSYLVGSNKRLRIILLAIGLSILNVLTLYVGNAILFYSIRIVTFLIVPVAALGKMGVKQCFVVWSMALILCGAYLAVAQFNPYADMNAVVASALAVLMAGVIPKISHRGKVQSLCIKIAHMKSRKLSALVDTGLLCSEADVDATVVVDTLGATKLLTDEEFVELASGQHRIPIDSVTGQSSPLPYVDIRDLKVISGRRKPRFISARVVVTSTKLPSDALISIQSLQEG